MFLIFYIYILSTLNQTIFRRIFESERKSEEMRFSLTAVVKRGLQITKVLD